MLSDDGSGDTLANVKKRILIIDSGSYKTFGGSVKAIALMYRYLSSLDKYDIKLAGDFSGAGVSGSMDATKIFAKGKPSPMSYYRMIARRFFFKGKMLRTYSPDFFDEEFDLIIINSRMDVPVMDEYKKAHSSVKTMYIDRANLMVNNAYALVGGLWGGFIRVALWSIAAAFNDRIKSNSTSFLGSLGTVYVCHLMKRWLDTYVGIVPEQVTYAKRFFTKRTHVSLVGLGIGPEYKQLDGYMRDYRGGIYVGRLDERQKHVSFLIRGIRRVIDAHPELKDRELLRIFGEGPDQGSYRRLSESLGLGRNVRFMGTVTGDGMVKAYNDSGFCVSASEWESPGRVFIEAMACGVPLLLNGRNNAAISADESMHMVEAGQNGLVYEYGDLEDFSKKFYSMYSNVEETERMGGKAASFARRHFSLDRQNKGYSREIESLLGK